MSMKQSSQDSGGGNFSMDETEIAKELSLEKQALEKLWKEHSRTSVGYNDLSSGSNSASTKVKRSNSLELKSRPRPGPSPLPISTNQPLVPPPSSTKSHSTTHQDLMSFSPTEKTTDEFGLELQSNATTSNKINEATNNIQSLFNIPHHLLSNWQMQPYRSPPPIGWNIPLTTPLPYIYPIHQLHHTVIPTIDISPHKSTQQIFLDTKSDPPQLPPRKPKATCDNENLIDLSLDTSQDKSVLEVFDPLIVSEEPKPPPRQKRIEAKSNIYECFDPFEFMLSLSQCSGTNDPVYEAVAKELSPTKGIDLNKSNEQTSDDPPLLPPRPCSLQSDAKRRVTMSCEKPLGRQYENVRLLLCKSEPKDPEIEAFTKMVIEIRGSFVHDDPFTNTGFVCNPLLDSYYPDDTNVKLVVHTQGFENPVTFTCDVSCGIEHIVSQVLCSLDNNANLTGCFLRVKSLAEYIVPPYSLRDFDYVHQCLKHDQDVELELVLPQNVQRPLLRIARDDMNDTEITTEDLIPNSPGQPLSFDNLTILIETLEKESDRVRESSDSAAVQCQSVVQAVKAICALLGTVESIEVTEAVHSLQRLCDTTSSQRVNQSNVVSAPGRLQIIGEDGPYSIVKLRPRSYSPKSRLSTELDKLQEAIYGLVTMYARAFRVNFQIQRPVSEHTDVYPLSNYMDTLLLRICAVHRPSYEWDYSDYLMAAQVYHGSILLGAPVMTMPVPRTTSFHPRIVFNQWLEFKSIMVSRLPRESRLVVVLYGRKVEVMEGKPKEEPIIHQVELGWASLQFFNYESVLADGHHLLSMWPVAAERCLGPAPVHGTHPDLEHHSLISLEFPELGGRVKFPTTKLKSSSEKREFSALDRNTQQLLCDIIERDTFAKLEPEEREILWEKRHYLYDEPAALPKVLLAAHNWDYTSLSDIHSMLKEWKALDHVHVLQLLMPCFPDMEVRCSAVQWLEGVQDDLLVDFLPQLVEALKHESYEPSGLASFLLHRSLASPRLQHHLYWLLASLLPGASPQNPSESPSCPPQEARHHRRLSLLLRAILATSGIAVRQRFLSQQLLDKSLYEAADRVKSTKESLRLNSLLRELESVHFALEDMSTSLPLSPGMLVGGLNVKACSYFTSNTLPLKLTFTSPTPECSALPVIYKVGDDLRQDQLTLQMIKIMDKLWLREGLDLKIVTFGCIPTGHKRGMVEMVAEAETLRVIQSEHGLAGSFKDRPIAEWLAKHNPSQLEYQRAMHNFTASCAGYSVATYVLGICDRHNDNIMLTPTGHLFHIDFGKFLGDAQMFGNFKRDRVAFVLTSDMAYVINGEERPTDRFHYFVDLCCQAFNTVRHHTNLFLNLFALMASSGVTGVTADSVKYIQRALLPDLSNAEAAAHFARLIEDALKSWFTPVNFFLHTLGQMRFTGDHNDATTLSFVPKMYNKEGDGMIKHIKVFGYQKRYDPEKYYVYIIQVEREDQPSPSYLFRSYREFCELHQKLCMLFPLAKLHSLPKGVTIGRSTIKQVAEKRRQDLTHFLRSLFLLADEIKHCPLVYTFFHPLLRDQQDNDIHAIKLRGAKAVTAVSPQEIYPSSVNNNWRITGQLKLSLHYQNGALAVLVQHARNLACPGGQEPSAYVKVYLQPDVERQTKRKTKVMKKSRHPSFMEMLEYHLTLEIIKTRELQASVWHYDRLQENAFLGSTTVNLHELDLKTETSEWYPLDNLQRC